MSDAELPDHPTQPPDWVPADQRWLGFDRRTMRPALLVVAVAILFIVVIPLLTGLKEWDNPIKDGDVVRIGEDLTVVAPTGWNLAGGVRTDEAAGGSAGPFSISGPGVTVTFNYVGSKVPGSARDLLDRAARANGLDLRIDDYALDAGVGSFRTDAGLTGVRRTFVGASSTGEIVAIKVPAKPGGSATADDAEGLYVRIESDADGVGSSRQQINEMLKSIKLEEGA